MKLLSLQITADGRRNQVFFALSTAAEFRQQLSSFADYYAGLGPPNPDGSPDDGKLKSETITKDNRRYYLDLKENSRGRFLRVRSFTFIIRTNFQRMRVPGIANPCSRRTEGPSCHSCSGDDRIS